MTFDANIPYFVVDIINFEVVASILLFVYTNSFIIINMGILSNFLNVAS